MKVVIRILGVFVVMNSCQKEEPLISGIVFWEYDLGLSPGKLLPGNDISILQNIHAFAFVLPIDAIEKCYWSEMIFKIPRSLLNEYLKSFIATLPTTDEGSFFFSFVVEGKIIYSGLNRLYPSGANPKPYDLDHELPRIYQYITVPNEKNYYLLRVSVGIELGPLQQQDGEVTGICYLDIIFDETIKAELSALGKLDKRMINLEQLYLEGEASLQLE